MEIVSIKGVVEVLTGLHIGGSDDIMKIGGIDNPVIKTSNGKPYIPGSSIKGKMRSLLEWKYGLVLTNGGKGKPFGSDRLDGLDDKKREKAEILIKLFGDSNASAEDKLKFGITRISVSDCYLISEQKNRELTEAKYENVIDRRSGTALSPRQSERVSAGAKFDFDIRIKVLDSDNENELTAMVREGLNLIKQDYLGGSGSRGYGRVKFDIAEDNNAATKNND
ncbi:MAG: type III-A CRISPR-associated RAMP protein Csm3 [Campylobacteraceae bacterium]|jgi:CRISPR-associated protein Csm3|nr:type III-A CRISPR-associated RAMP protein Csm3 [Campylobacteraceae bacterium]